MIVFGQLSLLLAIVCAGFSAFACVVGQVREAPRLVRSGHFAAVAGALALSGVVLVLLRALLVHDFRLAYVADYSSRSLPWQYALSALWVGQAGSLLLWAWLLAGMAITFRFWPWQVSHALRDPALGIVMGFLCFLLLVLVFAADPMRTTSSLPREGGGLSPLLQHPSMLIHPPVVFAGYALWSFPFALAMAALLTGQLNGAWVRIARPWALLAWTVLGLGIVLGAQWAYEELGWGGYWGWDPVENGSLLPWLTGTALVRSMMVWKRCGQLKKTCLSLALATFGLCIFATFLTRSGVFSSVHAFSQSPIGWLFLSLLGVLVACGGVLLIVRRESLRPRLHPLVLLSRESLITSAIVLIVVLAAVVLGGTLVGALSTFTLGRTILVGPAFYNSVFLPAGLLLIAITAAAPLCRWRRAPAVGPWTHIAATLVAALLAPGVAVLLGLYHPVTLLAIGLAGLTVASLALTIGRESRIASTGGGWRLPIFFAKRREYGGFVIHVGLSMLVVGVLGSSYGTSRYEAVMDEGQVIHWAGRNIRYLRLIQQNLPEKLVAAAELQIEQPNRAAAKLYPARQLYLLQNEWTTEVAIDSTWQGDLYVILHSGEGGGRITLSFIDNPLMRWIWCGAALMGGGAMLALWPRRRNVSVAARLPSSLADNHRSQDVAPRRWAA